MVMLLATPLNQVERTIRKKQEKMFVDRGCHGHGVSGLQVFISRLKRGVNTRQKRLLKRRKATQPVTAVTGT